VHDAPRFSVWPPVDLGVHWSAGRSSPKRPAGDPFSVPSAARLTGWLLGGFVVWNGWTLSIMVANQTAALPGGVTRAIGLVALDAAIALLWPSTWGLLLVPLGVLALTWGAIAPDEQYLSAKFGPATMRTGTGSAAGSDPSRPAAGGQHAKRRADPTTMI
jgi:hypothetical protein